MTASTRSGRLDGEHVLVTGGAQGIGSAIADTAREQGARVAVLDLKPLPADAGPSAVVDVSDHDAVQDAVAALVAEHGAFTVLVNNAGRNVYGDPVAMSSAEWDDFFGVDLKASWSCAKAVLPAMLDAGHGSIVNIASLHARLTTSGMFPYAAAKSGLVGFTRSLALEVARQGVRVNAVSPGYIRTPILDEFLAQDGTAGTEQAINDVHPFGRIGTPDEVAQVVCFLASRDASYVTGADWAVDGGLGARFA